MGIKVSEGGGKAVFYKINAKDGCFQQRENGVTHQFEAGRTTLEGTLIGAKFEEDEFEGVKTESVRLVFRDTEPGQPNMHVSFTVTNAESPSKFALRLLSKINASAPGEVLSLNPFLIKKGEKLGDTVFEADFAGVSVGQNGQKIVEDFGTPDNKLPEPAPVLAANGKPFMQNGRAVTDKSAWVPILDAQLEKLFGRFAPAESQAQGEAGGVDPDEVAQAAAAAAGAAPAREAMRARG